MNESRLQGAPKGLTRALPGGVPWSDSRNAHRLGLVETAVAAVVLVAATAFAQSIQHAAPSIMEPAIQGGTVGVMTADHTDYSEYPGGAGGISNGHLSASQEGEPLGAAGTSGGLTGPIARTHAG